MKAYRSPLAAVRTPAAYAVLDLRAINTPDVFKTLPPKTDNFDAILPD